MPANIKRLGDTQLILFTVHLQLHVMISAIWEKGFVQIFLAKINLRSFFQQIFHTFQSYASII